jgi:hypothetical protein
LTANTPLPVIVSSEGHGSPILSATRERRGAPLLVQPVPNRDEHRPLALAFERAPLTEGGGAPLHALPYYLRKRGRPVWCTRIAPDETLTAGIRP